MRLMQADLFTTANRATDIPLEDADVRYYPGFLENADGIFGQLREELAWRQDTIRLYGKPVLIPRLNAWYGDPDAHYQYSGLPLPPLPWTPTLLAIRHQLQQFLQTGFNSVLANLYRDQRDSVAWHADDEPELGREPLIASISLGAERRFSMRHRFKRSLPTRHIDLESGSLLVMAGPTQAHWHHQVAKSRRPIGPRINLTFRRVATTLAKADHA